MREELAQAFKKVCIDLGINYSIYKDYRGRGQEKSTIGFVLKNIDALYLIVYYLKKTEGDKLLLLMKFQMLFMFLFIIISGLSFYYFPFYYINTKLYEVKNFNKTNPNFNSTYVLNQTSDIDLNYNCSFIFK